MKKVLRMSFVLIMCVTYLFTSFLIPVKAQQVTESYSGYWYANLYNDYEYMNGTSTVGYADITIVTTSENAVGSVSMTFLQPGTSLSFEYSGKVTYYSHVKISGSALISQNPKTGTFTGTATYIEQGTELDATQLQAILDAIDNVDTTDQSILSYLATMKTDIESKLTDLISAVTNIDNLIDTISWINVYNGIFSYSDTYNGTYVNTTNSNIGKNIYFDTYLNTDIRRYPSIVRYTLPLDGSGISNNSYLIDKVEIVRTSDGVVRSTIDNWYVIYNRTSITLFIYNFRAFDPNDVVRLHLLFKNDVRSYRNTLKVDYIDSNDIEYWQLLAYFETHAYYDKEYPSLEDTNEDLDPVVDDYIQTEDSLISDFDNAMTDNSVNPSTNTNANTSTWGNLYTSSIGFVGFIYNELLNSSLGGNPLYLMVNFSLMLGLALLIIGKRA